MEILRGESWAMWRYERSSKLCNFVCATDPNERRSSSFRLAGCEELAHAKTEMSVKSINPGIESKRSRPRSMSWTQPARDAGLEDEQKGTSPSVATGAVRQSPAPLPLVGDVGPRRWRLRSFPCTIRFARQTLTFRYRPCEFAVNSSRTSYTPS